MWQPSVAQTNFLIDIKHICTDIMSLQFFLFIVRNAKSFLYPSAMLNNIHSSHHCRKLQCGGRKGTVESWYCGVKINKSVLMHETSHDAPTSFCSCFFVWELIWRVFLTKLNSRQAFESAICLQSTRIRLSSLSSLFFHSKNLLQLFLCSCVESAKPRHHKRNAFTIEIQLKRRQSNIFSIMNFSTQSMERRKVFYETKERSCSGLKASGDHQVVLFCCGAIITDFNISDEIRKITKEGDWINALFVTWLDEIKGSNNILS